MLARTPESQLVLSGEVGRQKLKTAAYLETDGPQNPFYATVSGGTDSMDVIKLRASASHAFNARVDATLWGAWAKGFNAETNVSTTIVALGTLTASPPSPLNWFEYGLRIGYRVAQNIIADAFANGISGDGVVDTRVHVGGGLRVLF